MDIERLRGWFLQHKRVFPWRDTPTPYQVWISEVMLQQTQALRVVDYYNRWMQKFDSILALANAEETEVLKTWEGLGYYSRAKSLHLAAKILVTKYGGKLPACKETLLSIPGLGPYTVGAILSFGFHQKEPAVDANVARVLTRFFALKEDISKPRTLKTLQMLCAEALPEKKPWEFVEALIELGALICQKKPACALCPIKEACKSNLQGTQKQFPVKSQKTCYEKLYREVCVIVSVDNELLVREGKKGTPCSGLYEFTYFDCTSEGHTPIELQSRIKSELKLDVAFVSHLDEQKQSFTRYRVTLYPKLFTTKKRAISGYHWCHLQEAHKRTFSSGHKRVLQALDINPLAIPQGV